MAGHPVDIQVGKILKYRRTLLGMSQAALARAVGITFQQVQKYERGINRISVSRLYDFSRVLGIPVSFFFHDIKTDEDQTDTNHSGYIDENALSIEYMTRDNTELMRHYRNISDSRIKRKVVELLRTLADADPVAAAKDCET